MKNLILTSIVFISTVLSELAFLSIQGQTNLIPTEKYLSFFIILFIFSFIRNNVWRRLAMNMVVGLSFFQMMHLQFFGIPVYPNAIYLLFAETGEIAGTLIQQLNLFFIPLVLTIIPLTLNLFTDHKLTKLNKLKSIPYLHFLFLFYLVYNPLRTYVTGNTWGRQPSTQEFLGMNIYLSSSYFLGRILPAKLSSSRKHEKTIISLEKDPSIKFDGNIILVLGESQAASHMSLFDYKRETTPFLKSIKDDDNFFYRKAISSGVSTDVSVAFFLNNTFGKYGVSDVVSGKKCFFNLAKQNNISTRFYSSQSQQQLRYITNSICPKFIDDYKNLDTIQPNIENENAADDLELLTHFFKTDINQKNFTILHQRGGHSPYKLRYPKNQTIFKLTGKYQEDRVNHYDNAVFQLDLFMKKLIEKVQISETPTIVIYVSDHGEGLGEEGVWGHASLKRPSVEIPFLVYTHQADELKERLSSFQENPTHLDISLFISQLLGHKALIKDPNYTYIIYGNDMDGFAGYAEAIFENGKLKELIKKDI